MYSTTNSSSRFFAALFGVLLVCLAPAVARAEKVTFRNECRSPVVVQTATVDKGVLRRDEPILLQYGECTPKIKADVDRLIMIYDGKANRMLFREVLKASKKELYYSIVFDPRRPGRVQVVQRPAPATKEMQGKTKPKMRSDR
jgi:hypothetical protein